MNTLSPDTYTNGYPTYWLPRHEWIQRLLLQRFMVALAEFEGYYIKPDDPRFPSIAQRNLNPGNLRPVGASTGFRTFTTEAAGFEALLHQIKLNIKRGLTLEEFFLGKPGVYPGYAPLGDNDPETMDNYLDHMARRTGFAMDIDLRRYFPYLVDSPAVTSLYYVYRGFN